MIKLVKVISILTLAPALAPGAEGALPTATEAARSYSKNLILAIFYRPGII